MLYALAIYVYSTVTKIITVHIAMYAHCSSIRTYNYVALKCIHFVLFCGFIKQISLPMQSCLNYIIFGTNFYLST